MLKGIDHIVVMTPDLDTAIQNYQALGFTVVPGGRHPTGTHNALVGFADGTYIELVAFYQPNTEQRWWELLQKGGGLVDFCMQTDDLKADIAAFRATGANVTDPWELSRVRPDGYKLDWVLATPADHAGVLPFLIEDITPHDERVPRQKTHPNGVTGIGTLTIAVDDVTPAEKYFGGVLKAAGQKIERPDITASGVRFTAGAHTFDFVMPSNAASPVKTILEGRGAGVFAATLKTTGVKGALDVAQALNARLTLV